MSNVTCPFCAMTERERQFESANAFAVLDAYPVNPGHTLVIPRAHSSSLYDIPPESQAEVWSMVASIREALIQDLAPDGFTIGLNDGEAAGQTVAHAHVHVIPRFSGDVPDPRGGIRWIRPETAAYWER